MQCCNRKVEDMSRELVEMRVGTSLSWKSVETLKEKDLVEELEMLRKVVVDSSL